MTSLSIVAQDKIYVWSEVEPGWKTRAIDYWSNVSGYGKSVPLEMKKLITDNFSIAEKTLDQTLKEQLFNSGIPGISIFTNNPGAETLGDKDVFLDLQCMIFEASEAYPNYRTRKLNIEPIILYRFTLYNALGEIIAKREVLDKVNYKYRIRPLVRGMSDHRRDIEIIKQSFLLSMSGPIIGNLTSQIEELLSLQEQKNLESDPEKFKQVVELLFDKRKIQFPGEYENILYKQSKTSIVKNTIDAGIAPGDTASMPEVASKLNSLIESGHYYALFIGIDDYSEPSMNDLDEPISDALRLYNTLVSNYIFDEEFSRLLYNPTRDQIIQALDKLASEITDNDNLLIFYAGHGLWDEQLEKGFWLPSDASAETRSKWFSNSNLRDYIGGIKSKHTLLITDACFSGGIFKTRDPFLNTTTATLELYKHPSRKAMTSGNMSMVPDKSVFVDYLIQRLDENKFYSLSSEQLFASFKIAVINNSATNQIPKYGEIRECGDEGGDFLFIRRIK